MDKRLQVRLLSSVASVGDVSFASHHWLSNAGCALVKPATRLRLCEAWSLCFRRGSGGANSSVNLSGREIKPVQVRLIAFLLGKQYARRRRRELRLIFNYSGPPAASIIHIFIDRCYDFMQNDAPDPRAKEAQIRASC